MAKTRTIFKTFSAAFLLVLYLASTVGVEWLHEKIHDSVEAELHSPEAEQNSCHLALYHQAADCGHDQHITKADKCDHCQFVNTQVYDFSIAYFIVQSNIEQAELTVYVQSATQAVDIHQSQRGPPATEHA